MELQHHRRRRERGASAVELALVLLPLMALLFAIVDFTLPVFMNSLLNHAVRAGVRYGVTYRTEQGLSHSQSIKTIVQRNAGGFLSGSAGMSKIHVRFFSPTTFQQVMGADANAGGNILEVSVEGHSYKWIAPLFRAAGGLAVTVRSADRLEMLPRGVGRPAP